MFCTFLYNNCDDGVLFKSVFYRKYDAILSVWTAFQDYAGLCFILVCIFVSLLYFYHLYVYSLFLSVLLPALANKVVHYLTWSKQQTAAIRPTE